MKNLLYIVIVAAISLFTASAPKETVLPSAPSGAFARIESGRTLAVQNGFTVSFSGEDGFIKRLELRSPDVIRPGRCGVSKRFVFMPDKGFGIIRRAASGSPRAAPFLTAAETSFVNFLRQKAPLGKAAPTVKNIFVPTPRFLLTKAPLP